MGKIRIVLDLEVSDMGPIMVLVDEGRANIRNTKSLEDHGDADTFIREARAGHHDGRNRESGLRVLECILAVMQGKPDAVWDNQELGVALEGDFGFDRHSVSSGILPLVKHGYVTRPAVGKYTLTDFGREHPQNERLPFGAKDY